MPQTSISLLERIRQETDADAWKRFVLIYTPWVDWVLRQSAVSVNDVDDLRQDVLAVGSRRSANFNTTDRPGRSVDG